MQPWWADCIDWFFFFSSQIPRQGGLTHSHHGDRLLYLENISERILVKHKRTDQPDLQNMIARKKKKKVTKTVHNIFIHFVFFSLEIKEKIKLLVMFFEDLCPCVDVRETTVRRRKYHLLLKRENNKLNPAPPSTTLPRPQPPPQIVVFSSYLLSFPLIITFVYKM